MLKNIVFDMGNVLIHYDPQLVLDRFCETEEERTVIYRELFQGEDWVKTDLGLITDEELFELVKKRVPEEMHGKLKECVEHWDICLSPIEGAKEFLEKVRKKGYHTYVISNASYRFHDYFPTFYNVEEFKGIVVSADLHIIKPDARIYQYLLDTYHLNPEECLFLDDVAANVEGAKAVGMQSIQFHGNYDEIEGYLDEMVD